MKNNGKFSFISVLWFLLVFNTTSFAATGDSNDSYGSVLKVIVAITAFLIALVFWLVLVYAESNDAKGEMIIAPLSRFIHLLTQSTSMQEEEDIMLEHDFDGIRELDNKIPPWWTALFYGGIIFAFIYMINYHVIGDGNVQLNEYKQEMQTAKLQAEILSKSGALISEESVTILTDAISLASGKEIYTKNCVACHGAGGEGIVGPNLTDDYWISGGSIKNIYHVISEGVPAKGMITWKTQLSPNQIQEVASYVHSLRGTNPPNPKAPQGEKWDSSQENTNTTTSDNDGGKVTQVELKRINLNLAQKGK